MGYAQVLSTFSSFEMVSHSLDVPGSDRTHYVDHPQICSNPLVSGSQLLTVPVPVCNTTLNINTSEEEVIPRFDVRHSIVAFRVLHKSIESVSNYNNLHAYQK